MPDTPLSSRDDRPLEENFMKIESEIGIKQLQAHKEQRLSKTIATYEGVREDPSGESLGE